MGHGSGAYALAEQRYQEVLARTPQQPEARLGMAELARPGAIWQRPSLAARLAGQPAAPEGAKLPPGSHLYQALGEGETARAIFTDYEPLVAMQPASQQTGCSGAMPPASALPSMMWKRPWCGIARGWWLQVWPPARIWRGRADPAGPQSGWGGVAGIRPAQRSDRHYRQSQTTFSLDSDYWGSSGTGGYSDLRALTQMAQLDTPLAGGTAFGRP